MRELDGVISPARILNAQEEIAILRELLERSDLKETILGSGSARIVFDSDGDYVIKLGVGESGYLQNMRELERFQEDKDEGFLAILEGIGRFILLQEKVDAAGGELGDILEDYNVEDDDEREDCANEIISYMDCSEEEAYDMIDTYKIACEYYDETTDNAQLGKTEHRGWVLYDYGFAPGEDTNQSSGMSYTLMNNIEELRDYIQYCINLLEAAIAEDEMLTEMRKADNAISNGTPFEEEEEEEEIPEDDVDCRIE